MKSASRLFHCTEIYKDMVGKLENKSNMEDLGLNQSIILQKEGKKLSSGFILLSTETSSNFPRIN
jgi:hypothetical protein